MFLSAITAVHVLLSLIGIATGIAVARDMMTGSHSRELTGVFLVSTLLTNVTGFMFPFHQLLPSHVVGIISLIVLAPAFYAYYSADGTKLWRTVYASTALVALYLNVFVLVAQFFQKIPGLNALAPTQAEPPFAIAQLALLAVSVVLGRRAVRAYGGALPKLATA